jgi:threonyl-tRNA synthetase
MMSVYRDFGFEHVEVKLATRPEKRVGTDAMWDHAEDILRRVLERMAAESGGRIKTGINEGEGTFYGPKFEYTLKDAIGRDWQCGTTQVDFNLPERFGAFYIGPDGEKKQPVMVHRAICGSLERFLGILIESYAGHFPLWLAPEQILVCPITSEADGYGEMVTMELLKVGLRARADLRNEKINYKVREHSLAKVPIILAVGKREAEERTVSIRRLGSPNSTVMGLDEALASFMTEAKPPS